MGVIGVRLYEIGKCMGTLGVIGDHLYEIWEVYGDPRGSYGVVYI